LALKSDGAELFLQGGALQGKEVIALADGGAFKAVGPIQPDVHLGGIAPQGEASQSVQGDQAFVVTAFLAADDDKIVRGLKAGWS